MFWLSSHIESYSRVGDMKGNKISLYPCELVPQEKFEYFRHFIWDLHAYERITHKLNRALLSKSFKWPLMLISMPLLIWKVFSLSLLVSNTFSRYLQHSNNDVGNIRFKKKFNDSTFFALTSHHVACTGRILWLNKHQAVIFHHFLNETFLFKKWL